MVTSSARAAGQGRADLDHEVRAAALHDLLVDRAELLGDLLLDILLVALELLLLRCSSCARCCRFVSQAWRAP